MRNNKYSLLILGTGILIFFANLDSLYVNIMEARNFITAREMVQDDHWLLTTMNAQPRYEKPPLPTWLTALSGMIFGFDSLMAMRLPAALVTLLLLFFFYKFIPKIGVTQKQSFLATLVLATSFYIVFMGRNGQWDIFTHSFMMVGIYFLLNFFRNVAWQWKNVLLGALFIGFSIMSKGPVPIYALLLPFLISFGITSGYKGILEKWKPLLVLILLSLIIGGWWFVYARLADPEIFLKITTREATRWTNYNVRPFYYYWSFFTQSGIWTIPAFVALLYPYLKNKVKNKKAYRFSFFWTITAVVLLSIIPEKKSRYLLPVLIPMALNTSFYIEYLFRRFPLLPLKEKWLVFFNHGLIAFIGIAFPVLGYFFLEVEGFWFWYISTAVATFSIGIAILFFLKKDQYPQVFYLTVSFIVAIVVFGMPLSNAFLENPHFRNISELRKKAEQQNLSVYEYDAETPELIWEFGKPIPQLDPENLQLPQEKTFGILILERDSSFINELQSDYRILSSERYDLNYVHPEKGGYKNRLIRKFYVLQKKE